MDIGVILTILWPYVAALYFLDCFLVVRGGHTLFSGTTFTGFRARGAGLRLTGLLPWGWSVLSIGESLLLSEKGVYARVVPSPGELRPPGPDDLELIPWEGIVKISREGRKVIIDQRVVHTAPSGAAARLLAGRITTVRDTPANDRRKAVGSLTAEASNLEAVREQMEAIKRSSSLLLYASTLLFVLVLVSIPVSLLARLPLLWLRIELALVGAVFFSVVVLWWRAHRTLLPDDPGDRLEELMAFVFFPVSAMHAFGKLTRRLLVPFDSSALMAVLVPEAAGEALRREYAKSRAAAAYGGGEDLVTMWEMRTDSLEKLAIEAGVDFSGTCIQKESSVGEVVCPLCLAAYREGVAECADCLVPLTGDVHCREASLLQQDVSN
jgi:hypothetical protein